MARRLARMNDVELVLDDTTSFGGKNKYSRQYMLDRFPVSLLATAAERRETLDSLRRSLRKWWDKKQLMSKRQYIVDPGGVDANIHSIKIERADAFLAWGLPGTLPNRWISVGASSD